MRDIKNKFWKRTGFVLLGFVLLAHWLTAILAISKGKIFAYQNYFGAPQEAYTLVFILAVITPLGIVYVWRHWR